MATEKRLIDANYFVNKGIRNCPIEEGGIPLGDFDKHQKILKLYPTVDAVEVVHGRWVKCKDWDYDYECSVCEDYAGEDADGDHIKLTPYCPNCGAKMDGDGNG